MSSYKRTFSLLPFCMCSCSSAVCCLRSTNINSPQKLPRVEAGRDSLGSGSGSCALVYFSYSTPKHQLGAHSADVEVSPPIGWTGLSASGWKGCLEVLEGCRVHFHGIVCLFCLFKAHKSTADFPPPRVKTNAVYPSWAQSINR